MQTLTRKHGGLDDLHVIGEAANVTAKVPNSPADTQHARLANSLKHMAERKEGDERVVVIEAIVHLGWMYIDRLQR